MEFLSWNERVIIATKGLPFSGTALASEAISRWEIRSPVFRLDVILDELYKEGKYNGTTSMPSKEEDERLKRLAFSILCRAASVQLEFSPKVVNYVVIDVPLSSTSQLDQLIGFNEGLEYGPHKLLIIECRRRHKFMWQKSVYDRGYWFEPKSWNEMEKAIEDYDGRAWDQHFDHLCGEGHLFFKLKRLVLDPEVDIAWNELSDSRRFSPLAKAIEYLLTDEAAPPSIDYRKWRKQQAERLFIRSNHTATTEDEDQPLLLCGTNDGDCKFAYTQDPLRPSGDSNCCRACEEQLITGEGAYKCVSCNLPLHKACAELQFETHHPTTRLYDDVRYSYAPYVYEFPAESTHACKSCTSGGGGGGFSYKCRSCIFETHLKCGKVPTVVNNPPLHPHPLSIQLTTDTRDYQGAYYCESCSVRGYICSYYCVRCNSYYHMRCAHSPGEVQHEHQGYHHLMKLIVPHSSDDDSDLKPAVFSGEEYVDQDDFWCDVCYNEIDADAAFYRCPDCPDYVAHVYCISPVWDDTSRGRLLRWQ